MRFAWDNTVLACCFSRRRPTVSILTCVPGSFVCLLPASASGLLMGRPHNDGLSPRTAFAYAAADADFIAHSTGRVRRIASPQGHRWGAPSSFTPRSGLSAGTIRGCHGTDMKLFVSGTRRRRNIIRPRLWWPEMQKSGAECFDSTPPEQFQSATQNACTPCVRT